MEKDFLQYVNASLDKMYDYFLSDAWLSYQTNFRLLAEFIQSCTYSYPDVVDIEDIYKYSSSNLMTLREQWSLYSGRLIGIADEIEGRKRPGPNDIALCYRAQKTIRELRFTMPEKWMKDVSEIPEKIVNIIDDDCRYFDSESKR